jgi:hypothetical protein
MKPNLSDRHPAPRSEQQQCPECNGTDLRDAGGVYAWGDHVSVPCDHALAKPALTKESLDAAFGTENALHIRYYGDDRVERTPDEMDAYFAEHGEPAYGESQFPDGTSAVCCTNYAIQIGKRYPQMTQIFGFANENNPQCEIVQRGLHPGGHDFAVVDQRWLTDPWVRLVASGYQEIVYDLDDPNDAALVLKRYGSRENWRHMTGAEELFLAPTAAS